MSDYEEVSIPAEYGFDPDQIAQLLKPINENRIMVANKHRHIPQQEVRAHLIRIFGFGNFDEEVISSEFVFENPHVKEGIVQEGRFDVCYRATVGITIRNRRGLIVCQYEEVATATAQNQSRGDAHDLALKSAVSTAFKRCTINLGDQFGLSLYNKGQLTPIVKGVLVAKKSKDKKDEKDIQENSDQATSLGLEEDSITLDENGVTYGSGKKVPAGELDKTSGKKITYTPEQQDLALSVIDEIEGFADEKLLEIWYNSKKELANVPVGKTTINAQVKKKIEELRK